MEIHTIGFTTKTAAEFFETLRRVGIRRLIDVRLNNTSQLAAFTKRKDIEYFLRELCDVEYLHLPELSPSKEILDAYKKKQIAWEEYEVRFVEILHQRKAETLVDRELFRLPTVLLCSEPAAQQCHRRLVAEYLRDRWGDVEIVHL